MYHQIASVQQMIMMMVISIVQNYPVFVVCIIKLASVQQTVLVVPNLFKSKK